MDEQRFDNLARLVGRGASRRAILKGLFGFGGAAATGGLATGEADARALRTRPTIPPPPPPPPATTTTLPPCPSGEARCGVGCCPAGTCRNDGSCCEDGAVVCSGGDLCCPEGACARSGNRDICCDGSDGNGAFVCGLDCCSDPLQCCDRECCAEGSVCLSSAVPGNHPEEICCPFSQVCGDQCCDGECYRDEFYFNGIAHPLPQFDHSCCPAGGEVCEVSYGGGYFSSQCCAGETPVCCVRPDPQLPWYDLPSCLPEGACCTDADCPGNGFICCDDACVEGESCDDPVTTTPAPGTTTTADPGTSTTAEPGTTTSPDPGTTTSPDPGTTTSTTWEPQYCTTASDCRLLPSNCFSAPASCVENQCVYTQYPEGARCSDCHTCTADGRCLVAENNTDPNGACQHGRVCCNGVCATWCIPTTLPPGVTTTTGEPCSFDNCGGDQNYCTADGRFFYSHFCYEGACVVDESMCEEENPCYITGCGQSGCTRQFIEGWLMTVDGVDGVCCMENWFPKFFPGGVCCDETGAGCPGLAPCVNNLCQD